ncbi:hypothetical protein SBADM41S_04704 [Streptomyces badius]
MRSPRVGSPPAVISTASSASSAVAAPSPRVPSARAMLTHAARPWSRTERSRERAWATRCAATSPWPDSSASSAARSSRSARAGRMPSSTPSPASGRRGPRRHRLSARLMPAGWSPGPVPLVRQDRRWRRHDAMPAGRAAPASAAARAGVCGLPFRGGGGVVDQPSGRAGAGRPSPGPTTRTPSISLPRKQRHRPPSPSIPDAAARHSSIVPSPLRADRSRSARCVGRKARDRAVKVLSSRAVSGSGPGLSAYAPPTDQQRGRQLGQRQRIPGGAPPATAA